MTLERKTPLKRGKPLKAGKPLARGKPLKRGGPIKRKVTPPDPGSGATVRGSQERTGRTGSRPKRTPPRSGDVSPETRALVMHRAGYRCEVRADGCTDRGLAPHHRLSRKHGIHTPENLVVACVDCHTDSPEAIHRNRRRSVAQGLIIPSSRASDPIEPWIPPWWPGSGPQEIPR